MSLPAARAVECTELSASQPSSQESLRRLPWCTCVSASARQSRAQSCAKFPSNLEHLECGHQPHVQDRGAEKRTQLAGRSASGYGLESPSPGGARSQGHNTGLRGLAPCTGFPLNCRTPPLYSELKNTLRGIVPRSGFPLAAERPLYSELVDTTLASDTRIRTAPAQLLEDNTRIRSCETPIKKQRGKVRRL